ncbi:hypothetical protein [Streptomyces kebangsaanensis]|uniref:hypothetical protein n=1 Tax=Streptomyces kebangsaanensis TaxID=864058 RepID=UPI00093DD31C|nr:hypothetical protein [Streptomyces kebangsaanensis]
MSRSSAITAGIAAAAALTATGITYATAAPVPQAAPAVVQQAPAPAQAPMGGEGGQGKGNEGGEGGERGGERGHEKKERHHRVGRIFINERSFSARPDGCITVVSGLGAKSFNIRNDSKRTVEFFRGATCDNGAPIATVGPHSEANNVRPKFKDEDENCEKDEHEKGRHHEEMEDGVKVKNGVVGSFRVIKRHHGKFDFNDFNEFDD